MIDHDIRNLKARSQRFKVADKAIKTFSGVATTINSLPDPQKLWALLGLNCGMTNADLGEMTWDMIELKSGILTRKRVKTKDVKNVPIVRYKLWKETLDLLKALPGRQGLVFTTAGKNSQMYTTRFEGDKAKKKDLFSTYWQRLEPKPSIPLAKFRSVAATTLKTKGIYRGFVKMFLGHVADELADKHYAAESDEPFFEALDFIRESLLVER